MPDGLKFVVDLSASLGLALVWAFSLNGSACRYRRIFAGGRRSRPANSGFCHRPENGP